MTSGAGPNVGRTIWDFYCNGAFGRVYDMAGSVIEAEGADWIVVRKPTKDAVFTTFYSHEQKNEAVGRWCVKPSTGEMI